MTTLPEFDPVEMPWVIQLCDGTPLMIEGRPGAGPHRWKSGGEATTTLRRLRAGGSRQRRQFIGARVAYRPTNETVSRHG